MSTLRDAVLRAVYAAGWRFAARIPRPVVGRLIAAGSAIGLRRGGPYVDNLRRNLTIATTNAVDDRLLQTALASYLRNFYEVLALPGWPSERVLEQVTTVGEDALRSAFSTRGAVVPLPHSANWDLAGAWACQTGMPVTTVAEQLGDAEFRAFVAFREGLGMRVLSHADRGTLAELIRAVSSGRLVCLVADRDLLGTGVDVGWGAERVTMPGGPALVARRSGAALIPAVCSFTPGGMRITFGDEVPHRPGRDGLQAMTQDVATFFAAQIARHPEDWHMMQPFFPRAGATVDASEPGVAP